MSTYYEPVSDDVEKPLFGEQRPKERVINLVVGAVTATLVGITLVSAFVFPGWPPHGMSVYFAICIVLICASNLVMIYWYRQGDVDPKFRTLIFYNAFTIVLICVCANLYFHGVK
ncbi:transmembrane protein 243-like [Saccoglossus kowalevskii]|uniref:Transmembrane protein 243-like n=1 Tax=Saccoglossus kowalevskii TaxID=10224 RepID=A0ABM0GW77_SACKO|nr:PREDICTED: transmembrane protein 243-like [Saccoglossus kowalevskii]